jgi:hypothetical protein
VDRHVWIGEYMGTLPAGWCAFPSIDEFVAPGLSADQIIVNDPAALLRQADWLALYAAAPLARIVRRVGPWRAGSERTDPQWPGVVTITCESVEELLLQLEQELLPHTAGYDERAASACEVDLAGLSAVVQIGDAALKAMWEETLLASGATLSPSLGTARGKQESLCVTDKSASGYEWIIRLAADPWNVSNEHRSCEQSPLTTSPSPGGRGEEAGAVVVVASVLDAPADVLSRLARLRASDIESFSTLSAPQGHRQISPGQRPGN